MGENFAGLASLVAWFEKGKRSFPWRSSAVSAVTPYAVWISEVMLQQTRAEVVVPYFQRWITRFPDISSLAQAKEEEVIKAWEGLGYYARARRLLQAARYLVEHHDSILPATPNLLAEIPGFGPYTVGAVASFAFHLKAAAVDGNVLRFLSRYLLIRKDIAKPSVQEEFRKITLEMLPDEQPWVVMEAMIELGALVCKKTPACAICPVSSTCRAFGSGAASELPVKSPGKAISRLTRKAAVVKWGDQVLIKQVSKGQVMAGLFEFPIFEEGIFEEDQLFTCLKTRPVLMASFDDIRYSFTNYIVTLKATVWGIENTITPGIWPDCAWVDLTQLRELPFSSGHRRLYEKVLHFLGDDDT